MNTIPWLQVIDDELICSHLGVANEDDNYATAKRKLEELIAWHVAVATDPRVNGGYSLVKTGVLVNAYKPWVDSTLPEDYSDTGECVEFWHNSHED